MEAQDMSLILKTRKFRGVEFQMQNNTNDVVLNPKKTINPMKILEVVEMLKDYLHNIVPIMHTMNYYRYYSDNIEEMLDEDEKYFNEETANYDVGGNFAFFLGAKRGKKGYEMADNNKAAAIIQKKYTEHHPAHKIDFDSESSHCYFTTTDREEARKFMRWMDVIYFQPWVSRNLDGWDELVAVFKEATDRQKELLTLYF